MILVTGGLGFIGAHTAVTLLDNNFEVLIVDDLSNTSINVLDGIEKACGKRPHFEQIDLKDKTKVTQLFETYTLKGLFILRPIKPWGKA